MTDDLGRNAQRLERLDVEFFPNPQFLALEAGQRVDGFLAVDVRVAHGVRDIAKQLDAPLVVGLLIDLGQRRKDLDQRLGILDDAWWHGHRIFGQVARHIARVKPGDLDHVARGQHAQHVGILDPQRGARVQRDVELALGALVHKIDELLVGLCFVTGGNPDDVHFPFNRLRKCGQRAETQDQTDQSPYPASHSETQFLHHHLLGD